MYRFFDPPIHSITFSVDDLGLVPIYDMVDIHRDIWRRTEVIKSIPKKATAVAETSTIIN